MKMLIETPRDILLLVRYIFVYHDLHLLTAC
jgi:hypothetical protein